MVRRTVTTETPIGEIIVVLEGEEKKLRYEDYNLSFDSSDSEILEAISPRILEETGINLEEEESYTIKKVTDSQTVYLFPKSTAGTIRY